MTFCAPVVSASVTVVHVHSSEAVSSPAFAVRPAGEHVVADLASAVLDRIPALVDRLVAEINRLDPTYRASALVPQDDLWRSCHDNLQVVVRSLTRPRGEEDSYGPPRDTGRRRAQQGLPLESLLRAYRLGGRIIWQSLVEEARTRGPGDLDALLDGATLVWELVDEHSAVIADTYRATESAIARRSEEHRRALLDALIEGRGAEPALAREAAAALGLPEHGPYVVAVAAYPTGPRPGGHGIADALDGTLATVVARTRALGEVALVALGHVEAGTAIAALRARAVGRVGVSPVVDGLAEVGAGHGLAAVALRTLPATVTAVAVLDECIAAGLLVSSPRLAHRLAEQVLGELLELPQLDRDVLLATARALIDAGGSAARAAAALYCHRNTVLNRLRRIEALTHRDLTDPRAITDVVLALSALDTLASPDALPAP